MVFQQREQIMKFLAVYKNVYKVFSRTYIPTYIHTYVYELTESKRMKRKGLSCREIEKYH